MKVIQTNNYRQIKSAEAKGDDQYPSADPRHDGKQQGGVLFDNGQPATEDEIKRRWKKKKLKKKTRKAELPKGSL